MTVGVEIRRQIRFRVRGETHRYGENVIDGGAPADCCDIFSTNGTIVVPSRGTRYLSSPSTDDRRPDDDETTVTRHALDCVSTVVSLVRCALTTCDHHVMQRVGCEPDADARWIMDELIDDIDVDDLRAVITMGLPIARVIVSASS